GRGRGGRGGRGNRGERAPQQGQRERMETNGLAVEGDNNVTAGVGNPQDQPRADTRTERPARNGERGGRGRNGADRAEGADRPPRTERNQERNDESGTGQTDAAMEPRAPREPREGRDGRRERRPRQDPVHGSSDHPSVVGPVALPLAADSVIAGGDGPTAERDAGSAEAGPSRRPRERGGRDRGPRGERSPRDQEQAQTLEQSMEPQQALEGFAPATTHPAALESARETTTARPATMPAASPTAGMPTVQSYTLPIDSLSGIAQQAGLNWVNSDAGKIALAQAAIAAMPKAIRVPRVRPAPMQIDEGPLVLVETKRDLRSMKLPFEQASY
ncbi:MAG: hypothetical protein LH632_19250, partial [Rhodoferax sp.]|nr:hypothetical protein [Rhodoferax sp.]